MLPSTSTPCLPRIVIADPAMSCPVTEPWVAWRATLPSPPSWLACLDSRAVGPSSPRRWRPSAGAAPFWGFPERPWPHTSRQGWTAHVRVGGKIAVALLSSPRRRPPPPDWGPHTPSSGLPLGEVSKGSRGGRQRTRLAESAGGGQGNGMGWMGWVRTALKPTALRRSIQPGASVGFVVL